MIRRPPRSTLDRSSAASDVYKRQVMESTRGSAVITLILAGSFMLNYAFTAEGVPQAMAQWVDSMHLGQVPFLLLVNVMSVSYTHLRAHETVLDLVCRLLLEKKKQ